MSKEHVINKLIKDNGYKSYLEIGVGNPEENFTKIICDEKIGVDPYYDLGDFAGVSEAYAFDVIQKNWIKRMESDEFFSNLEDNKMFDIILIDGLHREQQCDKDLQNALKHLSLNGTIIVHDTCPYKEDIAKDVPHEYGAVWTGNVYKSVIKLKDMGIPYYTLDDDWGITAVKKPAGFKFNGNVPKSDITWGEFDSNRASALNIVSEDEFFNILSYHEPKVLLCCIAKMENLYLRDFVEYYRRIGVSNIVLYDNNDKNGEYPQQVIGDYISEGFVIYKNARGMHRYQLKAYTECYEEYKGDYDWICFFDVDEFIELTNTKTIGEFLSNSSFYDTTMICLYWRQYGDNGLLHYDSRPVYERFKVPNQPFPFSNTYKAIIRGSKSIDIKFSDANSLSYVCRYPLKWKCKNSLGEVVECGKEYSMWAYDNAYIKHYVTLTIDEFLARRFGRRAYADENSNFTKDVVMKVFYNACDMTPEKEKIIDDFFSNFEMVDDLLPESE